MITFERVTKRFPRHEALSQVSFHIDRGELVFLTGHSGAGKSTLLKLIPLLETPTQGQVIVGGADLAKVQRQHVPYLRRSIGLIFQDPHILFDRTVFDNVALPLVIAGYRHQEIVKRVRVALDKVDLLSKETLQPDYLSSGEQQRVSIARAIVHQPGLILADEPTGNLDPALSEEIMKLFARFNQLGATVLIASHDHQLISQFDARRLSLHQGQLQ